MRSASAGACSWPTNSHCGYPTRAEMRVEMEFFFKKKKKTVEACCALGSWAVGALLTPHRC